MIRWIVLLSLLIAACKGATEDAGPDGDGRMEEPAIGTANGKIGTSLRRALQEDPGEPLALLVRVDDSAAGDVDARLAESGLEIGVKAGDLYLARGEADAVRRAAELPFVISLDLSERRR